METKVSPKLRCIATGPKLGLRLYRVHYCRQSYPRKMIKKSMDIEHMTPFVNLTTSMVTAGRSVKL